MPDARPDSPESRAPPRRRWVRVVVLAAAICAAVFLGPRVDVETAVSDVSLPDDLDAYLERREDRVPDLVPGTEKTIVWATPGSATELSVVYLHGFSASRQETRPLAETVAAELDANLFLTRLTGHGRSGEAMAEASVNDWLQDVEEALTIGRRLGERVVLIGTSQGGTLATWAAAQPRWRDELAALVLVSPNFGPRDRRSAVLTWPWGGLLARLVVGETRSWEPVNDVQARYWTTSYPTRALLPMMGLVDLVVHGVDLTAARAPALLVQSRHDAVVDPAAARAAFERLGSERKEVFEVDDSKDPYDHVLAGDALSPNTTARVAERIVRFVREARTEPGRLERPGSVPGVAQPPFDRP